MEHALYQEQSRCAGLAEKEMYRHRWHARQAAMQSWSEVIPPLMGELRLTPTAHEPIVSLSQLLPSLVTLQKPARQPAAGSRFVN